MLPFLLFLLAIDIQINNSKLRLTTEMKCITIIKKNISSHEGEEKWQEMIIN